MGQITYVGESLWIGHLGHIFIILGFVSAFMAAVFWFFSVKNRNAIESKSWNQLGRISFITHGVSVITLILLLFYAMYTHRYEYFYVYDHVSDDLPLKYILSAFWEGQEGSFLLWMFWHVILGFILMRVAGKWEASVLFSFALAEAVLMSMILGIHIPWGDEVVKIGSNPTTLLRQMTEAPIFANAEYLSLIKGRGLNPLLQNYWMTIHPPTLFLGFASTLVPFAYAFAGLWVNDHRTWLKDCLPWSLFSAGILGIGILMGSLWAYVALSFGGYWAWDPVENASLVPWITLVAGIHVHLVSKNTQHASKSMYFFYLISFVLILYSTYLTRSGVLGDTSAHSFTEMGLGFQLVFLVSIFIVLGMGALLWRLKSIDTPAKEEELPSREFWMFIGSLVLLFSGVLITYSTSLPVINKVMGLFNENYEGRVIQDVVGHHNKYQLWIGVFISLLSAFPLFLRYGGTNWLSQRKQFFIRLAISVAISLVLTLLVTLWLNFYSWQFGLLTFAGLMTMVTNLDYLINKAKGKIKLAWSAIAHMGFGMMIVGTVASGLNQKSISTNPFVFQKIFNDEDVKKYVQLIKGKTLFSEGYLITYVSDTLIEQARERKYTINFQKLNDSMEVVETFNLHPNAVYSNDFSKVAAFNPDTKHYLHKDIFTCVVGLPPSLQSNENAKAIEDSLKYNRVILPYNDTLKVGDFVLELEAITYEPTIKEFKEHNHDTGLGIQIKVRDLAQDTVYNLEPALGVEGALLYNYPATVETSGIKIKLSEDMLDDFFTPDETLEYKEYTIKNGGNFILGDKRFVLKGFDKDPKNPNYKAEEKDLALSALVEVQSHQGSEILKPLYVIRDNVPMSIKAFSPKEGIHLRFSNIDPEKEEFTFKVAQEPVKKGDIVLNVSTDVPRTDYLILQATIFPGINLFWVGCIFMMLALILAGWDRYRQKR